MSESESPSGSEEVFLTLVCRHCRIALHVRMRASFRPANACVLRDKYADPHSHMKTVLPMQVFERHGVVVFAHYF